MEYRHDDGHGFTTVPWMPEESPKESAPVELELCESEGDEEGRALSYAAGFRWGVVMGAVLTAAMLAVCSLIL